MTLRRPIILCASLAVLGSACAAPAEVGAMRFANQAPVWKVNDRADVPVKPAEREFPRLLYFFDAFFFRALTDAMEMPAPRRAMNINALGEVPDSTWFTNRIGVRDLTASEIARGPNASGGPDPSGPWRVTGSKVGGRSVGFIMKDPRGIKYIVKFDEAGIPVVETATDVVLQRLLLQGRRHERDGNAAGRAGEGERGSGAASGVLHHRSGRRETPGSRGRLDDRRRHAILHAPGGVVAFELQEDACMTVRNDPVELDQGSPSDRAHDRSRHVPRFPTVAPGFCRPRSRWTPSAAPAAGRASA